MFKPGNTETLLSGRAGERRSLRASGGARAVSSARDAEAATPSHDASSECAFAAAC